MIRKTLILLAAVVLGVVAFKALRAESTPGMKFAVVDFQRAINETNDGKKAEASLNAALAEKKKKFDLLKSELDAMKASFDKDRLILTGQALEDKKLALQKKLMEVEQTGSTYEQELGAKKSDALKKILTGLQTVVQNIGKKDNFNFIFERSQGGVLFTSGTPDITDRVIQEYNATAGK